MIHLERMIYQQTSIDNRSTTHMITHRQAQFSFLFPTPATKKSDLLQLSSPTSPRRRGALTSRDLWDSWHGRMQHKWLREPTKKHSRFFVGWKILIRRKSLGPRKKHERSFWWSKNYELRKSLGQKNWRNMTEGILGLVKKLKGHNIMENILAFRSQHSLFSGHKAWFWTTKSREKSDDSYLEVFSDWSKASSGSIVSA